MRRVYLFLVVYWVVITNQCITTTSSSQTYASSPIIRRLLTTDVTRSGEIVDFFSLLTPNRSTSPVTHSHKISSTFGPRWQASQSQDDFHRGIDFFDEADTPIFAVQDGTVFQVHTEASGTMPGGGNVVVIEHDLSFFNATFHDRQVEKWFSYYMHLNAMKANIAAGDPVTMGEEIGTMGQTGTTSFTHLHFEARLNGYCSLQYQVANDRTPSPTSFCATGYDPHVHPFVFVGGNRTGPKSMWEVEAFPGYDFAVRYNTTRGHLDFNAVRSNFGTVAMDTRRGIENIETLQALDNLTAITTYMSLRPGYFVSTTGDEIDYEFHFRDRPTFVEVLDIYGHGIRWASDGENDGDETSTFSSSSSSDIALFIGLAVAALVVVLFAVIGLAACARKKQQHTAREADLSKSPRFQGFEMRVPAKK